MCHDFHTALLFFNVWICYLSLQSHCEPLCLCNFHLHRFFPISVCKLAYPLLLNVESLKFTSHLVFFHFIFFSPVSLKHTLGGIDFSSMMMIIIIVINEWKYKSFPTKIFLYALHLILIQVIYRIIIYCLININFWVT